MFHPHFLTLTTPRNQQNNDPSLKQPAGTKCACAPRPSRVSKWSLGCRIWRSCEYRDRPNSDSWSAGPHQSLVGLPSTQPLGAFTMKNTLPCGCGSKNRYQNGTLANGNMSQTLRNPSCLILGHTHVAVESPVLSTSSPLLCRRWSVQQPR